MSARSAHTPCTSLAPAPGPSGAVLCCLQKMEEYLGCTPESDARGVLQDVHWSAGLFG